MWIVFQRDCWLCKITWRASSRWFPWTGWIWRLRRLRRWLWWRWLWRREISRRLWSVLWIYHHTVFFVFIVCFLFDSAVKVTECYLGALVQFWLRSVWDGVWLWHWLRISNLMISLENVRQTYGSMKIASVDYITWARLLFKWHACSQDVTQFLRCHLLMANVNE